MWYSLLLAAGAIMARFLAEYLQIGMNHWAMISSVVTFQSLRSSAGNPEALIQAGFERIMGAALGIVMGFVAVVYMQLVLTDLLRSTYYVILFLAIMVCGVLESYVTGFRVAAIACLLMINLVTDPEAYFLLLAQKYASAVIVGVVMGVISSIIYHLINNNRKSEPQSQFSIEK